MRPVQRITRTICKTIFVQTTVFAAVLLLHTSSFPGDKQIKEQDFSTVFKNYEGTIVIYDQTADSYIVHNKARSITRFTPFSTFKIPNSIIALETGTVKNIDTLFLWDTSKYLPEKWWPAEWKQQHHNLRTAIRYSVVPFYREIASRVGEKRMSDFVKKFNYGNMDISSGIDTFWLAGSIQISAMEQIGFLQKFYNGKLGVKESTTKAVREILIQEETNRYKLSAKTGGGGGFLKSDPDRALVWYVGYVEKDNTVYFFALNIEGKNSADIRQARIDITRAVLKELGII
jgi:beta-lactamase class D